MNPEKKLRLNQKGAGSIGALAETLGLSKSEAIRLKLTAAGLPEEQAAAVARYVGGFDEGFLEFLRVTDLPAELLLKLKTGLDASRERGIELTLHPYPSLARLAVSGGGQ